MTIGDRKYIGKDMQIDKSRRLRSHLNLLTKNKHYNKFMQNAWNKYNSYKYEIIIEFNGVDFDNLSRCESFYIDLFDTYTNGLNLTKGGEGGRGLIVSDEGKVLRSERTTGEMNPQSKLTNNQFFEIVELLKEGETNKEIADTYGLHDRYVSLIRHKKRFKNLWKQVDDYEPLKSEGNMKKSMTEDMFVKVIEMIDKGRTNAYIEKKFGLSSGTASRIRNKRTYKQWWEKFFPEEELVK